MGKIKVIRIFGVCIGNKVAFLESTFYAPVCIKNTYFIYLNYLQIRSSIFYRDLIKSMFQQIQN